ncbi:MAG: hypothetical protein KC549_18785 [Myxococcales bacterium]|nr:hypothetical protein [Myxococcales bacterium]
MWIFMAMLSPAIVLSSVLAWLAALLLGPQLSSYLLGVIGGTIASSVFYIFLLARAFDRWQPTAAEGGMDETEYEG